MELEISSSTNVYAIQQTISDMVWGALVPEMGRLFDRMVGKKEIVRLDKIEIDLGEISLQENNTKAIVDQIVKLLEEQCNGAIREIVRQKRSSSEGLERQSQQPLRKHHFSLWLYWLEHGKLPTYAVAPKENWLNGVLETLALEDEAIEKLQSLLKNRPIALHRLILQHSAKDLKSLVELYTGFSQTQMLDFLKELKMFLGSDRTVSSPIFFRDLEVKLWTLIFQAVILRRERLGSEVLTELLIRHPKIGIIKTAFEKGNKVYRKKYPLLAKAFQELGEPLPDDTIEEMPEEGFPKEKNEMELPESPLKEESPGMASPQFFKNAGMVLLHPFLSNFFTKLNLLEGKAFKDFESQCKAVLLMQFLTEGESSKDVSEYEMVLPKFLCDMPVNLPLDHTLTLSDQEKEEGDNLLQAVIDHWGALGSTSPNGLREGFLKREGKLVKEQSGWKLYVEQKALDVLLDKLPWNLSMIKLPWMKELLYVEWR